MQARGKTEEEVKALLDEGVYDMQQLVEGGWVTAVKYPDELQVPLHLSFVCAISSRLLPLCLAMHSLVPEK